MKNFQRTDQFLPFSHLVGEFTCSYAQLVALFGEPEADNTDGYKVSTEWCVTDGEQTFTLYDYKETCLYDDFYPSVAEFRAQPSYSWHIGGTVKPTALVEFLEARLASLPLPTDVVVSRDQVFDAEFKD